MYDVDYYRPPTLADALSFLNENARDTAILGGGTDVMVDMRSGELNRKYLLEVGRLEEARGALKKALRLRRNRPELLASTKRALAAIT